MSIRVFVRPINNINELLIQLLIEEFEQSNESASYLVENEIKPHLDKLKQETYIVAETSYVDKVYRDSFYRYFSSKRNAYKRDCIRLSLFSIELQEEDFRMSDKISILKNRYLGFIILRPTTPFIIGRSSISPKALRDNSFMGCYSKIESTVNGVKMSVEGFPHSSQDTETITCAETTLWAIMEYFGSKYPEYKPVLPSKIIQTLERVTTERQLPSKGLAIEQISFALKEFGFGTRMYSRSEFGDKTFDRLLSCYVESGIPIIVGVDDLHLDNGTIAHAIICMGHKIVLDSEIDSLPSAKGSLKQSVKDKVEQGGYDVFDWDDVKKEFIFIDDNCPIYQTATLQTPTGHYHTSWHGCKINHMVVPLYPKIYLEAFEAKNFVWDFISNIEPMDMNTDLLIRFYLTSSRSYKDRLALNSSFDLVAKEGIIKTRMGKFIWVAEFSTKELMKGDDKKAQGLMIIDATEANLYDNRINSKPLIIALYNGNSIQFDKNKRKLSRFTLPLQPFIIYENNLKKF